MRLFITIFLLCLIWSLVAQMSLSASLIAGAVLASLVVVGLGYYFGGRLAER